MGLFDHCSTNNCAVLKHVLKVYEVTVVHMLSEIVGVVEMNNTFFMRFYNFSGEQNSLGNICADLTCHIVSLYTIYSGVFVGIFLFYFLIIALDKAQNLLVGSVGFSNKSASVTIGNISSGNVKSALIHYLLFNHIFNFFNVK